MTKNIRTCIETVSGRIVDLSNPSAEDIHIEDIAWALSREARYGAHTIQKDVYSVGQHSMCVANIVVQLFVEGSFANIAAMEHFGKLNNTIMYDIVRPNYFKESGDFETVIENSQVCTIIVQACMAALLHDAPEAYLRDVPTPAKRIEGLGEAYAIIEKMIMDVIIAKFGLNNADVRIWELVHFADMRALSIEAYHLVYSRGQGWLNIQTPNIQELRDFEFPYDSLDVCRDYMEYFETLNNHLHY